MDFVKMHGLGNDFVFIEDKTGQDKDYTALARAMCNRHTGIGADGLIVIVDSRGAYAYHQFRRQRGGNVRKRYSLLCQVCV